jgi:hypothetical protein
MSRTSITLLLSLTAVGALVGLVRVLRSQRADWNISSTFIFIAAWLPLAASSLATFTGGKAYATDSQQNPYLVLSGRTLQLTHLANYLAVVLPAGVILARLPRLGRVTTPAVVAFFLALLCGLIAAMNGFPILTKSWLSLVLLLIAAAMLPPGRGVWMGAAAFVISLASFSGLATLANFSIATAPCIGLYKCSVLGVFVLGVADNENGLALVLCGGLAFVWLAIRSRRLRVALSLYVLFMVVVSGARTAAVAAIIVLGFLLFFTWKWTPTDQASDEGMHAPFKLGLFLAGTVIAVFGLALPYSTNDPSAFTRRGEIWLLARQRLAEGHYGLGFSQPGWSQLVSQGAIKNYAVYSVHNQWLDVLWISGLAGFVVFLVILVTILRGDLAIGLIVLLPMLLLGITERPWPIATFDQYAYAYLATLMAVPTLVRVRSGAQLAAHGDVQTSA